MLLTSREQKLVAAFQAWERLTISEMLEVTGTSRRTLYRDLEKLQRSLPAGVNLQTSDEGYFLSGDLSVLSEARELIEYTTDERLYGELLLLTMDDASIASITENFGISQPTATSDLRRIEQTLSENGLRLSRERGLKILGREENIRSVLVSVVHNICPISAALDGSFAENNILSFLDTTLFDQSKAAFERVNFPKMTDKTRVLMQFFLTGQLLRLSQGHGVEEDKMRSPSQHARDFVEELLKGLSNFNFTKAEATYLAAVYDVLYFGYGRDVLFIEKFDTDFSYKIRKLIEEVSNTVMIEFEKDDHLYGLLYAHLKETDVLPELFTDKQNEFIRKISADNDRIFKAVQVALPSIFGKKFSSQEIAFVTLHFAATLERSELVLPLRAALVTNRGRISCEFLISNLRKNFPFLNKFDIIQQSSQFDKAQYDVIFTTEKSMDYIFVDRTMEQQNLDELRHKLRQIQLKTRVKEPDKDFVNLNRLFSIGNEILANFEISSLENSANLLDVIDKVVQAVDVAQPAELAKILKDRFDGTHLAIPETKIALLHGLHKSVKEPIFRIFDLSSEVEVLAMNRQPMYIKRVLVLLSPPTVSDDATYLLSKISSSIIENKLYTTIYDSGNFAVVSELLRQIIIESIRRYDE